MKRILLILLAAAILFGSTVAVWQFVPQFGVSWEDFLLRLEFYGYTTGPLMDGISLPYPIYSPGFGSVEGFPIVMEIPDAVHGGYDTGITFTLRTEHGTWFHNGRHYTTGKPVYAEYSKYFGKTATVPNGGTLYWEDGTYDPITDEVLDADGFIRSDKLVSFVDTVIHKDGYIIGFFVLRFSATYTKEHGRDYGFVAEIVGSASFPMIDGEYQDIRPECIEARIKEIKENTRNMPVLPENNQIKSG